MNNKRQQGNLQESYAASYLAEKGYRIIEQNFYCRSGEIDIIAQDQEYLVFLEVKFRSSLRYGYPEEAIDYKKRNTIIKAARYYMITHGISEMKPCRFDVIAILNQEIHHIKDAFGIY